MKINQLVFRVFITGIFFLITMSTSYGQAITKKDTLANYTFDQLSDKFYAAKPDSLKAVLYANYYVEKGRREKDTIETGEGYYYLSDITKDSTHFVSYWDHIIKITKQTKNNFYPAYSYFRKGDFYFHKGNKEIALKNYLLMQNAILLNKNDSLKSLNQTRLGMSKIRNGEIENALILFKKSYSYLEKREINNNNINNYYSLLLNISNTYRSLKLYDSALFYNKKMKSLSLKYRDSILYGYSLYNFGRLELIKKNYSTAIDSIKKSIPKIAADENYYTLSLIYLSLGNTYHKLKKAESSIKYYKKTDSIFQKTGYYYKSQKPAYKFLANYYKEKNNDSKQLEYINKYIRVDSILNARSKNISKVLKDNYDIPNLLAEKKLIENRLKSQLSSTKKWVVGISTLALILSFFLIHQSKKRKSYKNRFQELMKFPIQEVTPKEKMVVKKETAIPRETVENILDFLEQFENNHDYISSEITLSSLAKTFETNSKYLSQLINQYKGKSFNSYINELRINYTVEKLKTDLIFRKYSIKAIAYEVGFNTTESFSKAFYKNTGIRPSFFIKEFEKQ